MPPEAVSAVNQFSDDSTKKAPFWALYTGLFFRFINFLDSVGNCPLIASVRIFATNI